MRRIHVLTAIVALTCATAADAGAQTITLFDERAPRASLKIGTGGHGLDWEASVDSPLLADLVRVRGGVGQGYWDSEFDSYADPVVTRLAASALVFIRTRHALKPYAGLGFSAYVPRGIDLDTQTGTRLIAGMEGSGERWTVGLEVEIDAPHLRDRERPSVNTSNLFFTGRIGLAVRRSF
jgi:hypothetical protein